MKKKKERERARALKNNFYDEIYKEEINWIEMLDAKSQGA